MKSRRNEEEKEEEDDDEEHKEEIHKKEMVGTDHWVIICLRGIVGL